MNKAPNFEHIIVVIASSLVMGCGNDKGARDSSSAVADGGAVGEMRSDGASGIDSSDASSKDGGAVKSGQSETHASTRKGGSSPDANSAAAGAARGDNAGNDGANGASTPAADSGDAAGHAGSTSADMPADAGAAGSAGSSGASGVGGSVDGSAGHAGAAGHAGSMDSGATTRTLVLYDGSGADGWLGELNAAALGTLVSHFGPWDAAPVANYKAGDIAKYNAVVYDGSSTAARLPSAFLRDVAMTKLPVVWIDENIDQLAAAVPQFANSYGFMPGGYDSTAVASVTYKGTTLTRDGTNPLGIRTYTELTKPSTTLAQAVHPDGTQVPWAVRGLNLFYIGEDPLAYISLSDRYLAFCDLLFEALAPTTPSRHRALVRIEDVSARNDPNNLRQLADYLASQNVPFSVATIPQYLDPLGADNAGVPVSQALHEAPDVVDALKYMTTKGGTLIMHGYTHQYSNVANPYSGVSADDFEFYRVHFEMPDSGVAVYDGPVSEDSSAWATQRFQAGLTEFATAGLGRPDVFEWPHYWGSDVDSRALKAFFPRVYHQEVYFPGVLTGAQPDYTRQIGIYLPFPVRDVYGFEVIPENLDHYNPTASPDSPTRTATDIVADAKRDLVVRDGFASFFFHGYFTVAELTPIITGIQAAGYQFVAIDEVTAP